MMRLLQVAFVVLVAVTKQTLQTKPLVKNTTLAVSTTKLIEPTRLWAKFCLHNDDCPEMTYCDTSISRCLCYKYQVRQCVLALHTTPRPEKPCFYTSQCERNSHCDFREHRCECNSGFELDWNHFEFECIPNWPSRLGEHCFLNDHHSDSCGHNAKCDDRNFRCVCISDHFPSRDGFHCESKLSLGKKCGESENCGRNAICRPEKYGSRNTCQCPPWFVESHHGVDCVPSEKECHYEYQCGENQHCAPEGKVCECNEGYRKSGNSQKCALSSRQTSSVVPVAVSSSVGGCVFVVIVIFFMNRCYRRRRKMMKNQSSPSPVSLRIPSAPAQTPTQESMPNSPFTMAMSTMAGPSQVQVPPGYPNPYYPYPYLPPPGYQFQANIPSNNIPSQGKIDFD